MLRSMSAACRSCTGAVEQQLDHQHHAVGDAATRGTGPGSRRTRRRTSRGGSTSARSSRRVAPPRRTTRPPRTIGPPDRPATSVATTWGWSNTVAGEVRVATQHRGQQRALAAADVDDVRAGGEVVRRRDGVDDRRAHRGHQVVEAVAALRVLLRGGSTRRCRASAVNAVSPVRTLWARLPHAAHSAGSADAAWPEAPAMPGASERSGGPSSVSANLAVRLVDDADGGEHVQQPVRSRRGRCRPCRRPRPTDRAPSARRSRARAPRRPRSRRATR